jgi:F-type H+-transporting ATPase subunit a
VFGLEFPPINGILRWPDIFPTFNKIGLIAVLAALIGIAHLLARLPAENSKAPDRCPQLRRVDHRVHRERHHHADDRQAGPRLDAVPPEPVHLHLPLQPARHHPDPADAGHRPIAIPLALSLLVWATFIGTGLKHQGAGYFGHLLWPPGVPVFLKPLVGLIEFISTIIVTPFSLTVRLMANLLAGHILLVTFGLLTRRLFRAQTSRRSSCRWASCR